MHILLEMPCEQTEGIKVIVSRRTVNIVSGDIHTWLHRL